MMITATHTPSGGVQKFTSPLDLIHFMETCRAQAGKNKHLINDIVVDVDGVTIGTGVFEPHVPKDIQALIIELHHAHPTNIPKWHFIQKKNKRHSTGRTWYMRRTFEVTHIAISMGTDTESIPSIVLHEYAHALTVGEISHGKVFYIQAFELFKEYLTPEQHTRAIRVEWGYKKSSRYWYSEMYNITSILEEYRPRTYVSAPEPDIRDLFKLED